MIPIKKQFKKAAKITALLASASIIGHGISQEFFPEKIKNTDDLVRMLREEQESIKWDNPVKTVYTTYGRTDWGTAGSCKIGPGKYMIILDKEKNRTVLRHEIYHIYSGHCDKAFEKGEWTGWDRVRDEITARLYADYGLRL